MNAITAARSIASRSDILGGALLRLSAQVWWWVTLIGQWAFLFYLSGFYVRAIVAGHPENWNRNHSILKGYVPGDPAWNLFFGAHVTLAAVIAFGGMLQMLPAIRERLPGFHRWNGRVFMVTAIGGALTGLWMTLVRRIGVSGDSVLGLVALSTDAVLILAFAIVAWHSARTHRYVAHRRWALRLFMVANGVWFLRLGLFSWYLLTGGVGMTDTLDGPANIAMDFASFLAPLAILEAYLVAGRSRLAGVRTTAVIVMLAATVYMAIGIFALGAFHLQVLRKA